MYKRTYKTGLKAGKTEFFCEDHKTKLSIKTNDTKACVKCIRLRNQYRNTICSGCRDNRYNFQYDGDVRNAPTTGYGCWSLKSIRNGKCSYRR